MLFEGANAGGDDSEDENEDTVWKDVVFALEDGCEEETTVRLVGYGVIQGAEATYLSVSLWSVLCIRLIVKYLLNGRHCVDEGKNWELWCVVCRGLYRCSASAFIEADAGVRAKDITEDIS